MNEEKILEACRAWVADGRRLTVRTLGDGITCGCALTAYAWHTLPKEEYYNCLYIDFFSASKVDGASLTIFLRLSPKESRDFCLSFDYGQGHHIGAIVRQRCIQEGLITDG